MNVILCKYARHISVTNATINNFIINFQRVTMCKRILQNTAYHTYAYALLPRQSSRLKDAISILDF